MTRRDLISLPILIAAPLQTQVANSSTRGKLCYSEDFREERDKPTWFCSRKPGDPMWVKMQREMDAAAGHFVRSPPGPRDSFNPHDGDSDAGVTFEVAHILTEDYLHESPIIKGNGWKGHMNLRGATIVARMRSTLSLANSDRGALAFFFLALDQRTGRGVEYVFTNQADLRKQVQGDTPKTVEFTLSANLDHWTCLGSSQWYKRESVPSGRPISDGFYGCCTDSGAFASALGNVDRAFGFVFFTKRGTQATRPNPPGNYNEVFPPLTGTLDLFNVKIYKP